MKLKAIFGYTGMIVLITAITFLWWLLFTSNGTLLLVRTIVYFSSGTVEIEKVSGKIGQSLHVTNVTLRLPESESVIGSVDLKWRPSRLLAGRLSISSLVVQNVSIKDMTPFTKKPRVLSLPTVPLWLSFFTGEINDFSIDKLEYSYEKGKAFTVNKASAKIVWYKGILYVDALDVKSPVANVSGSFRTGLIQSGIRALLNIHVPQERGGINRIFMDARLPASKGKEQIAGPLIVKAAYFGQEKYSLLCRFGLTRTAVLLNNARLTEKGRAGTLIADAAIDLSTEEPFFKISALADGIAVAKDASTHISGHIDLGGTLDKYNGSFDLRNTATDWKKAAFQGNISGRSEGAEFTQVSGRLLDGTLSADVRTSWSPFLSIAGNITARNLNPAGVHERLNGNVNTEVYGQLQFRDNRTVEGTLHATITKSSFQGKQITGVADAAIRDNMLEINKLETEGSGFIASASGILQKRLLYNIRLSDASQVIPGAQGAVSARGWMRWAGGEFAGASTIHAREVAYRNVTVSTLDSTIDLPQGLNGRVQADARGRHITYGSILADSLSAQIDGIVRDHRIHLNIAEKDRRLNMSAVGGYSDRTWKGIISTLTAIETGTTLQLQSPSAVNVSQSRFFLSQFVLASTAGERLNADIDIDPSSLTGGASVQWQNLNIARANMFINPSQIRGRTTGRLTAKRTGERDLVLDAHLSASGALSHESTTVTITHLESEVSWNRSGLSATAITDFQGGGRIHARLTSRQPAALKRPEYGALEASWKSLDLNMLRSVLPPQLHTDAKIDGEIKGNLLPQMAFDVSGTARLAGPVTLRNIEGEFATVIRSMDLQWMWKGASLEGRLNMLLAQNGAIEATYKLPVRAGIPLAIDRTAPFLLSAKGDFNERGMISALLPGLVQETSGHLDFTLSGNGIINDPRFEGNLNVSGAGAYFPAAGVHLRDISAKAVFTRDRLVLDSLNVRSGEGYLSGRATAQLKNWRFVNLDGSLKGDRFQVLNLPEVQALASPELSFRTDAENIIVTGSIGVPEALFRQEQQERLIKPSPDAVVQKALPGQETNFLPVKAGISLVLGDRVFVKAYGVDTRLTGKLDASLNNSRDVTARGIISTVGGKYNAYDVKLDINRGRVVFNGGPLDRATLDVLATREVEDTIAGVRVTGTISAPLVDLYSRPAMSEMDIVSYIVLGRRGNYGEGDTALLARAAGTLLTSGRTAGGLKQGFQKWLGLDTIDLETGGTTIAESVVRIGKYLSPKLYISYGRSLFTGENIFGIRYSLSKKVDVESTMGDQSSVVLYYRIQFD